MRYVFFSFCIVSTLSNSTPVLYAFVDQSVKVTSCVECQLCHKNFVATRSLSHKILYVQNATYPSHNVKIHFIQSKLNLSKSGFLKKVKKQ